MLVPDYEKRSSSIEVHKELVEICRNAENDPRYLIDPEVESRARTNPPRSSKESPQTLALPERPKNRGAPLSQKQGSFEVGVKDLSVKEADDGMDNTSLMVHTSTRAQQVSTVFFVISGSLLTMDIL
ncbi:hypothetical protein BHE90_006437 [Fusarium euwallaceae]|uniref:Uncharacterized protein n=1 Tax=Fusarium euwallaceae TaxID=1147111 RepID=A0A430LTQ1_9HYPO|nr:hypothetical protein BHE90_006437 [Fusarium euwallaceae]